MRNVNLKVGLTVLKTNLRKSGSAEEINGCIASQKVAIESTQEIVNKITRDFRTTTIKIAELRNYIRSPKDLKTREQTDENILKNSLKYSQVREYLLDIEKNLNNIKRNAFALKLWVGGAFGNNETDHMMKILKNMNQYIDQQSGKPSKESKQKSDGNDTSDLYNPYITPNTMMILFSNLERQFYNFAFKFIPQFYHVNGSRGDIGSVESMQELTIFSEPVKAYIKTLKNIEEENKKLMTRDISTMLRETQFLDKNLHALRKNCKIIRSSLRK